jgi:hypothetical protein
MLDCDRILQTKGILRMRSITMFHMHNMRAPQQRTCEIRLRRVASLSLSLSLSGYFQASVGISPGIPPLWLLTDRQGPRNESTSALPGIEPRNLRLPRQRNDTRQHTEVRHRGQHRAFPPCVSHQWNRRIVWGTYRELVPRLLLHPPKNNVSILQQEGREVLRPIRGGRS